MYTPGKIIFFDPFYFKNGAQSKPKYFLVLAKVGTTAVLASLPSSKDYVPRTIAVEHGCIEVPEGCVNCYVFKAGIKITDCGFSFPMDTFLYGQYLDDFEISLLESNYPLVGIDYDVVGELTAEELAAVIKCFGMSATVKRKYKKILTG